MFKLSHIVTKPVLVSLQKIIPKFIPQEFLPFKWQQKLSKGKSQIYLYAALVVNE